MKSKITTSKSAAGARELKGEAPVAPAAKRAGATPPDWRNIAGEWANEYRRTSGKEAKILGYADGRIRVFTTRDTSYALGELHGMTLVLKRRQPATAQAGSRA